MCLLNLGKIIAEFLMAPKKKSRYKEESLSQEYDARIFVNQIAHARYQQSRIRVVIGNRWIECKEELYRHDQQFDEIRRHIITRGW